MNQGYGLTKLQQQQLLNTLQQFPAIESAILFGSRAKGTMHKRSDIDLAITGETMDRHQLALLMMAFDESDLPFQVDVKLLADIQSPALLEHISRVGKRIYP